jgi:hypothetical protein
MSGIGKNGIGGFFITRFPVPDTIGLQLFVRAHNRLIFQRFEGVYNDRQWFILDKNLLHSIGYSFTC